jgi:choline dehydrogenase-like flavoprotein
MKRIAPAGSCAATRSNSRAAKGGVTGAVHGMQIGRLPWGAEHHRAYRKLFLPPHRHGGDLRGPAGGANTVTLDPVLKDTNGIPAPKIAYTLSENSRCVLDHAVPRATEILRAAGAYDVWHEAPIPEGGWHLMGTARMGADPARSVVNEPNAHDPGAGALRRRQHEAAPGHLV